MQMTETYDHALLGILQHAGNIKDFLQVYFGFLYRKTDFYRLLSGPDDKMGFPPGVAEKMALKTFRMFEKLAESDRERQQSELQRREERREEERRKREERKQEKREEEERKEEESRLVPPALQELEVAAEETVEQSIEEEEKKEEEEEEKKEEVERRPSAVPAPATRGATGGASAPTTAAGTQQRFQCDPDSYNGAVRENYSWSQDYSDLEIRVFVPPTVVKGRQVRVCLQSGSMQVCVLQGEEQLVLMEGDFTHKINMDDSLWSLEPGICVLLSLSKTSEVWWNAVLKGEAEIDVNQINRERSMATVDEEEHAVLDRLAHDYHQKLQGKPQSHETKVHNMLKKGWEAEGSPFKGQQFDPSMFDIPPSAVQF
ncbi:nudC domain-containing protein 3 isoform X2 [Pseudoliparis swirei]|uniref:nudC domain-containing protein 3 isoform X2 n=1 Tax=Pseudoliparis swirei TaxID=2059687 RepID=UPI0024BE2F1A|nr:nudC domain-containing protein 3 isoform X2 [Pseudoliparis swirei]